MKTTPFCCDITSGSVEERNEFKRLFEKASDKYWKYRATHYGINRLFNFDCETSNDGAIQGFTRIIPLSEGIQILKEMVGESVKQSQERFLKPTNSQLVKMAGKPQMELIGYKINPESPITAYELSCLLNCGMNIENGLFFWKDHYKESELSDPVGRALALGIVGEGKWLVPVYKQKETEHIPFVPPHPFNDQYRSMDTSPIPEHYFKQHLSDVTRITGTYEQQKGGEG